MIWAFCECYKYFKFKGGAAPDPLRSSSGSLTGLPQSQTSSNVPSANIIGYDAYGRPITGPNYNNQGYGPSPTRLPSDRIKEPYGHGYPSTIDSQQPGVINAGPGSVTEQQPGVHTHSGRPNPNLGSSSFLNQPISSGKTPSNVDTNGRAPSILAGRKNGSNGSNGFDTGKLIDGTNRGGQPSNYNPSHETGSTNGRGRQPYGPNSQRQGNTNNIGSPDTPSSSGRNHPNRGGSYDTSHPNRGGPYDTSGYPDGKPHTNGNPSDSSKNHIGSNIGKLPTDTYGQTRPDSIGENGNIGTNLPSTDVLTGLRNAFKLPPGLCLVRCDTLRAGQNSLTPEQIRDAYISSGLAGKNKI